MSVSRQEFGFTTGDPVIAGRTFVLQFTIASLTAAEVASAEWVLIDINPIEGTPTSLVTKTVGAGIVLTDDAAGLLVTVTVDPADTAALSGDYFHRFDYVHTDGSSYEGARGTGRLTPRA